MLPRIDAQEGDKVASDGVLVGAGDERQLAILRLVLGQPRPTGALDAGQRGVHLLDEGLERTELGRDGLAERAVGRAAALARGGGQVLPEEGVVEVAAAVEVEEGSDGGRLGEVALGLGLGDGGQRRVEAVDVGLVVLGVVELHNLGGDVGLEGAVVVCVGRKVSLGVPGKPSLRLYCLLARRGGGRESIAGNMALYRRRWPLTLKVRKSGLAANKGSSRLDSAGSAQGAAGNRSSTEERGGHFDGCGLSRY